MTEMLLLFSTGVYSCIAVMLLLRRTLPAFKFLGVGAALLAYISFISFLAVSGKIADWPHLFRTQSPLQYLIGPIGMWTALWLVRPELSWQKVQYLHLVPFLLHTLELLPFYSLSAEEKVAIYSEYARGDYNSTGGGRFSYAFHSVCKSAHLLGYTLVWAFLLRSMVVRSFIRRFRPLLVWINIDMILKVLATGAILLSIIGYGQGMRLQIFGNSLLLLDGLFSALFLLVFPDITIEPPELLRPGSATGEQKEDAVPGSESLAEAAAWASRVGAVLKSHYQDQGLDTNQIAAHLFVSRRHLHRICRRYGIGTPMERLLDLRVNKGREQILADPEKPLTSIALEVGFSNPGYFSVHFKSRFGMLPSEFQQECKKC
ncbi:MAG: helix-turn-helix transcriptional regulator [Saprospiraceae bacterium]